MSQQPTALTDDQIFRGTVIALSDLRRADEDHPLYGAYRAAAAAWVNVAQDRLGKPRRFCNRCGSAFPVEHRCGRGTR